MDNEGVKAEERLREISDEIVQLKQFRDVEPANDLLIDLLEMERAALLQEFIRTV